MWHLLALICPVHVQTPSVACFNFQSWIKIIFNCVYGQQSCILEFDGASKGNPGPAGAGAVLRAEDGSMVGDFRVE